MPAFEIGEETVPPEAIDLHEALYYATDRVSFVLRWAELVGAWFISIAIFFGVGWFYPLATSLGFIDLYLGTLVFAATGVYAMVEANRAERTLEDWADEMVPFMYSIKFEMLPFKGEDREEDIWERFVSVYPDLRRMAKPSILLPWARRKTYVKFRVSVKGERGEHFFHIFGRNKNKDLFFVRRFEEEEPVTYDDLETLKEDVEDVLRKLRPQYFSVASFAAVGYDEPALRYAESDASLVGEEQSIDLFEETDTGYRFVPTSTD